MHHPQSARTTNHGFSFIELSIVMIIIGLSVGGIFVGKSLYESAKQRATISDIEGFNSAVQTFTVKYGALPGDFRSMSKYGGATRTQGDGRGDGDGMIENSSAWITDGAYSLQRSQCAETLLFWADLYILKLINKTSGIATDGGAGVSCVAATTVTPDTGLASYLPATVWGNDVFWMVSRNSSDPVKHHYLLAKINSVAASWGRLNTTSYNAVTTVAAYNIDTKMDDGNPSNGKIRTGNIVYGGGGGGSTIWSTADTGTCKDSSDTTKYRVSGGTGCTLQVEAPF